ncbi:hypothetical protein G6F24_015361 [Rhizopus arrhizus]|nr:hypothetical protein G6F24_015361 [Rhizopus arrhizus]
MPGKAQVGKKAHRAGRPEAEGGRGVVADCIGQWPRGITEVVAAAEFGQVAPIDRPQPAASEHRIELVQVEQQLRDRSALALMPRPRRPPAAAGVARRHAAHRPRAAHCGFHPHESPSPSTRLRTRCGDGPAARASAAGPGWLRGRAPGGRSAACAGPCSGRSPRCG